MVSQAHQRRDGVYSAIVAIGFIGHPEPAIRRAAERWRNVWMWIGWALVACCAAAWFGAQDPSRRPDLDGERKPARRRSVASGARR